MTKKDIEKQNEQIRKQIQKKCETLQALEKRLEVEKNEIRELNKTIDQNYERYYTL